MRLAVLLVTGAAALEGSSAGGGDFKPHGTSAAGFFEDMSFHDRTIHKTIHYLYEQGLGRGRFDAEVPSWLVPKWCIRPTHQGSRADAKTSTALATANDIGVLVMSARLFETTRVKYINGTWGRFFPVFHVASDDAERAGKDSLVDRIPAPEPFVMYFAPGSYMSHVYKGHLGLARLHKRHPHLQWYALISDDSYVYGPFLMQFLHAASSQPSSDAVCAGHLQRQPKDVHWKVLQHMFRRCDQLGDEFGADWKDLCKEKAALLRLPFVGVTYPHGAGIFCSSAAMVLLQPYLETMLAGEVFDMYGPHFTDFIQPSDELLGRCISELGIRVVDMQGYYAGSRFPGRVSSHAAQLSEYREGLPQMKLEEALRPALWHAVKDELDFDALRYFYRVLEHTLADYADDVSKLKGPSR
eukprot:TRINITY_DN29332_c0_g1_i1.p1 TRINITY_DN29332_c0_g1~~TRINITY_DN29332_c0_g1_i1.p1  ORF type:complete len:412 (-),score=69.19 TRINITY_DN29332_c0_g1_i1:480-1715(-)